jgi:hypothetical protein
MKIGDVYETYLRATDLQKPVQVKISKVVVKAFRDQKSGEESKKIVLSFAGARKVMILNKTQARAVAAAVGSDDTDHWQGRAVMLSAGRALNGQSTVVVGPVVPAGAGNSAGGGATVSPPPAAAGGDDGKNKPG